MKQNIAITGSSGLLGQYLCSHFSKNYNVTALYHNSIPQSGAEHSFRLDLTDSEATKSFFTKYQPDFLIHAAGLTSVDACEENQSLAFELNTKMAENVFHCLKPSKTRLIHISTDHLFAGEKSFYTETSDVHPINNYAKTKLQAEGIAASYDNSIIIRTNFYGGENHRQKTIFKLVY